MDFYLPKSMENSLPLTNATGNRKNQSDSCCFM